MNVAQETTRSQALRICLGSGSAWERTSFDLAPLALYSKRGEGEKTHGEHAINWDLESSGSEFWVKMRLAACASGKVILPLALLKSRDPTNPAEQSVE
jgi:hypothetical protein